jgi:hypothetical protein
MKIRLPVGDEWIEVDTTGTITMSPGLADKSDLGDDDSEYKAALDGITSLILACVCENVTVNTPAFIRALETAIDYINNRY